MKTPSSTPDETAFRFGFLENRDATTPVNNVSALNKPAAAGGISADALPPTDALRNRRLCRRPPVKCEVKTPTPTRDGTAFRVGSLENRDATTPVNNFCLPQIPSRPQTLSATGDSAEDLLSSVKTPSPTRDETVSRVGSLENRDATTPVNNYCLRFNQHAHQEPTRAPRLRKLTTVCHAKP